MKNETHSRSDQNRDSESDALQTARDNRADQLNPNNDKYYRARGLPGRPDTSEYGTPSDPLKR